MQTLPFSAWKDTIELLHAGNLETPLLVWNDIKRSELKTVLFQLLACNHHDAHEVNWFLEDSRFTLNSIRVLVWSWLFCKQNSGVGPECLVSFQCKLGVSEPRTF